METLSMSRHEIDQISIFEDLKVKRIKQKTASQILNLGLKQIQRKLKKYRELGTKSLIHGNRGRPGNRKLDLNLVLKALSLIKNHYPDFTPTFASEKLEEIHGLIINRETLRIKMTEAGLWLPKQKRITHRAWRERKAHAGELVQFDGSPHKWFEDRAPACTLLAFIDDATSKILWLEFAYEEATIPIMKATKSYLEKFGRPLELYVDRGKVFKVNLNNPDNDKITQYRRSLNELGINVIYARSPEAKGRVERLFGTLQDRLVKELRLAGINTMEEANQFVQNVYLPKHNQRFAVEPREKQDFHRTVEGFDLNEIFTQREERILSNDFTITYHHQWYQLVKKQPTLVFPKNTITVLRYLDGNIKFKLRSVFLNLEPIQKPAVKNRPIVIKGIKKPCLVGRQAWRPPVDHPWRKCNINYQQKATFLNC